MPRVSVVPSRFLSGAVLMLAAAVAPQALAQHAAGIASNTSSTIITVSGDVPTPLTLTAADLAAMPRATASMTHNGVTTSYSGVWLPEVLAKAGLPLGPGKHATLSGYVLAKASDGYQVLFSIGELDPAITDSQVLLADTANEQPLAAEGGRFRLVLPKDKRGARSMRMLATLEVVVLKKP